MPAFSLLRGAKGPALLDDAFGDRRIEELPLRFFCLSCDLIAREAVVHRTGPVVDAVYPSLAIPGVFPPVATTDGRLLVDGGVLDNLPVETMAATGEGPVIAVDVTGRLRPFQRSRAPGVRAPGDARCDAASRAARPRSHAWGRRSCARCWSAAVDTVAAARAARRPRDHAPGRRDRADGMEGARRACVELGRRAAREALAADPDWRRGWRPRRRMSGTAVPIERSATAEPALTRPGLRAAADHRRGRVLAIASLGAAVAFVDATIVNIAFPNIEQSFSGTLDRARCRGC